MAKIKELSDKQLEKNISKYKQRTTEYGENEKYQKILVALENEKRDRRYSLSKRQKKTKSSRHESAKVELGENQNGSTKSNKSRLKFLVGVLILSFVGVIFTYKNHINIFLDLGFDEKSNEVTAHADRVMQKKIIKDLRKGMPFSERRRQIIMILRSFYFGEGYLRSIYGSYGTCISSMGLNKLDMKDFAIGFPQGSTLANSEVFKDCNSSDKNFVSTKNFDNQFEEIYKKVKNKYPHLKFGVFENGKKFLALATAKIKKARQPVGEITAWTINHYGNAKMLLLQTD